MSAPPATTRSVLREPAFLRLWTGTTASGLATWALPFVLGLAVLEGSLDPVWLGVALGVRTVGFLAAVPVSGVLADRYSRRATVLWSGVAATAGTAGVAAGLDPGPGWLLVAGSLVAGAGQGACRPAFQALVAEIVEAGRRQQANAAMTFAVRVTSLVAPAGGALLATVLPVRVLVVALGVLWLVAAFVPPRAPAAAASSPLLGRGGSGPAAARRPSTVDALRSFGREFADGISEARRHPWFLAGLGALATVIATGYSVTGVALPLVSRDVYGSEAVLAGALTGYTVGALAGAVLIARWRPHARGWMALAGLGLYSVVPLALLVPLPVWTVVAAYVLCGVGIELFNVPWFTAVQREVDPSRLARVSSLDFLVSYGLAPLGLALIAPAITAFGLAPVLVFCAAACLVGPLAAALVPGTRRFSRDPAP